MLTKNLKKVLVLSGNMQGASLVAQMIKNLAALQETQVESLGWEDLWQKGMATHSSILVYWPGEFHGLCSPWGCKELGMTERLRKVVIEGREMYSTLN